MTSSQEEAEDRLSDWLVEGLLSLGGLLGLSSSSMSDR